MKLFNKKAGIAKPLCANDFLLGLRLLPMLMVLLCLTVFAAGCGKGKDKDSEPDEIRTDDTQESLNELPDYTLPEVALEENAYVDVNDLVNRYFTALSGGDMDAVRAMMGEADEKELIKYEKESSYIEEFSSVKVYTKPGPYTNSYVAFVYYEIKFKDIDTLAPGLNTLFIRANDEGALYIDNAVASQEDNTYLNGILQQSDVQDLFNMVDTKYKEASNADETLKDFMAQLAAKLDEEVNQALAERETGDGEGEGGSSEGSSDSATAQKVKAKDTVNVRSSDSENADRIGQVAQGDTITRYEVRENGWSRVDYNGKEGFIKSEYLIGVDEPIPETTDGGNSGGGSEGGKSLTAKGYVTIKETVNVRKSASTDSEKLGVAYENENYDLIMEQADGWCKIKYNGKTGYVKTEFVK